MFPTDTLYGLGCRPGDERAVARMYGVKGRRAGQAVGRDVLSLEDAAAASGPRTRERAALGATDRPDPAGLCLPAGKGCACPISRRAWPAVRIAILQTSANLTGGAEARRLADVPAEMRAARIWCWTGVSFPGWPRPSST